MARVSNYSTAAPTDVEAEPASSRASRTSFRMPIGDNNNASTKATAKLSLEARGKFRIFLETEIRSICDRIMAEHDRYIGVVPTSAAAESVPADADSVGGHVWDGWSSENSNCSRNLAPSAGGASNKICGERRRASRKSQGTVVQAISNVLSNRHSQPPGSPRVTTSDRLTVPRINSDGASLTVPRHKSDSAASPARSPKGSKEVVAIVPAPPVGSPPCVALADRPGVRVSNCSSVTSQEPVLPNIANEPQDDEHAADTSVEHQKSDQSVTRIEFKTDEEENKTIEDDSGDTHEGNGNKKVVGIRFGGGIRFESEVSSEPNGNTDDSQEPEDFVRFSDKPTAAPKAKVRVSQLDAANGRKSVAVTTPGHFTKSTSLLEDSDGTFDLHATWRALLDAPIATEAEALATSISVRINDDEIVKKSWLEKLMISPLSTTRMLWDVGGLMIMTYECIMLPLTFFKLSGAFMNMVGRIFWSIDLPLQFLTGYQTKDGDVITTPSKVVRAYAMSWFPIDVLLLSMDWIDYLVSFGADIQGARMAKATKSLRMLRLTRMMKLLYVVKHHALPDGMKIFVHRYFRSEVTGGVASILRMFLLWAWINHVCGCCWYGLVGDETATESNDWIRYYRLESASKLYIYFLSYHWSLSLYGCSIDIHPSNEVERIYAVFATLIAFVASAYIVSATTTSMTRVSIATAQEAKQFHTLRQYLFENGISSHTSERVQRNARHALEEKRRMKSEFDIELLELISQPLRVELHYEIYMPIMGWHPFLDICGEESSTFMRQVCHNALAKIILANQDLLFDAGEASLHQQMYFICNGGMMYNRKRRDTDIVRNGEWACEAVLWTSWTHRGSMRATVDSSLLALESTPFQKIASQFKGSLGYAQRYARSFCKYMDECDEDDLTDLEDRDMDVEWLASKSRVLSEAFVGAVVEPSTHHASIGSGQPFMNLFRRKK
eukprot:TRINITY_DN54545_c0_g1_i1.p1 TRINITY_DN54545_c0_g1~~TRINITY_DN54545_c0_g1_i1.p1  ORF type:complete len:951 (+),score=95.79 TRINITY_DN54545_c0_g1_i1:182-3034(+)